MVDRFLVWLSAGVVTAGMSAAMLTGAGLAGAQTESASDPSTRQPGSHPTRGRGPVRRDEADLRGAALDRRRSVG